MSKRIIFADERGKLEIDIFQPELNIGSTIQLILTPPVPQTEHYPLDAADARLLAAALMDYADQQDAIADTNTIPKIQDNDG